MDLTELDVFRALLNWATTKGVTLDGVASRRITGRGIGAIATESIKVGQETRQLTPSQSNQLSRKGTSS
jgi:hypothetical protein